MVDLDLLLTKIERLDEKIVLIGLNLLMVTLELAEGSHQWV